ncbi:MAG: glycosyltransferase [Chloroflexi bacterium]|nr:glycosyltransferase [Chloroflexota bacterium]
MTVRSVGLVALHSCPLSALGEGKAGGMSAYVLGLGRELARRGVGVIIVTASHEDTHSAEVDCEGVCVVHLPSPAANSASEWVARASQYAGEIQAAVGEGCDLVHTHYWASGLAGLEVSRLSGIPHVTTFHTIAAVKEQASELSPEPYERHEAERTIAQRADGIVAWTRFEANALVSMLGAERERIAVAPIGVDTERFRPLDRAEARSRLDISADEETLLYVGRLDRIKGADVLLRAAGFLADRPRLRVRIVGGEVDGDFAEGLRTLAADLNIAEKVSWIGTVPNDELPLHYAAADMVIVPSYSESYSIVAAEAMACGTPVVSSNVPGPASFIEDGVSGRLVAAGDAPALACAVQQLLDDASLRDRLGSGGLAAARQMTWGASADSVLGLYERVAAKCDSGSRLRGNGGQSGGNDGG